jgi:two-component system, cell cycle response regulator
MLDLTRNRKTPANVGRIILIDDSPSARTLIGTRLREQGWEVLDAPDATTGAELAMASPPDAVVTDLWMPGISGLQLCRLLRADPMTANVPVVLLTASDDRRTRFWARCAGAAAYVTKTEIDRLVTLLAELEHAQPPTLVLGAAAAPAPTRSTGTIPERLSQLLDAALFESTMAGEVRSLAHFGDIESLFTELTRVCSDVVSYRWMALVPTGSDRLMLHATKNARASSEREAREALDFPIEILEERRKTIDRGLFLVEDGRPLGGEGGAPALVAPIRFGSDVLGTLAIAPTRRGASLDDRRMIAIVSSELGGPLRMVGLVAEARRIAATDPLTNLMNRRAFIEIVARDRKRLEKNQHPWSVLLLDIDHFKRVNDTYGHDAGDAVLQGVATVLAKIARKSDHVARWGGEEFVVALVQTADAGARIAAERVRRAIAEARFALPNGDVISASASVGLASAQTLDWNLDDLVQRADKAMYNAKHRGRNRVETG